MKLFVRTLVVAMAVTGAIATTHSNGAAKLGKTTLSQTTTMPIPSCPLNDPNGCGIADGN